MHASHRPDVRRPGGGSVARHRRAGAPGLPRDACSTARSGPTLSCANPGGRERCPVSAPGCLRGRPVRRRYTRCGRIQSDRDSARTGAPSSRGGVRTRVPLRQWGRCVDRTDAHTSEGRPRAAWGPALRRAGEEFADVLKGTVHLVLESQPSVRLEAGDSVIFDSGRAHAAAAVDDEGALLLSAIMPNDAAASAVAPSADRPGEDFGGEVPLERPVRPAGTRARNGDAREPGGRRPRRIQDEHR